MIKLYLSNSCTSCRKARKWLQSHGIKFREIKLSPNLLSKEDLIKMLSLSENGFEDIISSRSKKYLEVVYDFGNLHLDEAIALIQREPRFLRRPLILDERRLLIGYNKEKIRSFIPTEVRRVALKSRMVLA
ncbi:Spx/MgsR family RNA polymerase-binding regulatory protein [Lactococcus allomyrinae]|uniref:Spx/MgsR family RNA polymerase-binding regulatory protein n=1 Tax=Lactococcus allomyrinae TaxID=2419773 RepID=A0A387BCM5_9LACT|nr:Spx/MgsR family RNA polymerase-binding regulatory protein [Lactococcus allomyrinae]AYG00218.1 Spx/MgsR family RNA polymerase-binding regulatory protein [Lactococcus allomyrinae]